MHSGLSTIAARILEAQDGGSLLSPVSSESALSIHEAYEVSWLVHEARVQSGWRPIGRKIGFTNREMWTLFGVSQPVWSFVYDRTYQEAGSAVEFPLGKLVQPKIEPEIVLCLRKSPSPGMSETALLECIEWMAHGIEMVHCHYPNWKFTPAEAISDSSFHGKLIVGKRLAVKPDSAVLLKSCEVSLYRGEELIEVGHGRNVLGSPLLAVASLLEAIDREASPYPLLPGEVITTGTMTKAYSVSAGEQWRTRFARDEFPGLAIDFT